MQFISLPVPCDEPFRCTPRSLPDELSVQVLLTPECAAAPRGFILEVNKATMDATLHSFERRTGFFPLQQSRGA